MTIRSQTSLIMGIIRPERPELFAFELRKIAEFDFVYTLASTNVNQSVPDLVKMNMTTVMISDELDYGCNQTRTIKVICP